MPTSVALGSHFEEFIRKLLNSGRFNNASEVVRARAVTRGTLAWIPMMAFEINVGLGAARLTAGRSAACD